MRPLRMVLPALFLAFLFVCGCIQIDVVQQFFPNGRSTVLQQVNLADAIATLEGANIPPPAPFDNTTGGWNALLADACANASVVEPGSHCHIDSGWLVIDQDRVAGPDYSMRSYDSFPYTIYILTVYQMPSLPLPPLTAYGLQQPDLGYNFSDANQTAVQQAIMAHMQYSALLEVPGEVTDYNAGTLTSSGVQVDVLDRMSVQQPIQITSRVLNLSQVALLVIVSLDLLLFVDVVAMWLIGEWRRRERAAREKARARQEEEEHKRIFRKNKRLKGNEVYAADKKGEDPLAPPPADLPAEWEE